MLGQENRIYVFPLQGDALTTSPASAYSIDHKLQRGGLMHNVTRSCQPEKNKLWIIVVPLFKLFYSKPRRWAPLTRDTRNKRIFGY